MQSISNQNSGSVHNHNNHVPPPPPPLINHQDSSYSAQAGGQNFRVCGTNEACQAPPVSSWGSRPVGDSYRTAWDNVANRLGTQNPIQVRTEIERQLYQAQGLDAFRQPQSNVTLANATAAGAAPANGNTANTNATDTSTTPASTNSPDPVQLGLDLTQMGIDIVGIFEPTPFADGTNTLISAGRGIGSMVSGNWGDAGGHGLNAILSAVGVIPYIGDAAKLGKIGKWAQTVADAITAIASNPALRSALEPALRSVKDAIDGIPQGALDKLPQSARESIEGMKRQLDEFFGAANTANRIENGTLILGANRGASTTVNGRPVTIGDPPNVTSQNGRYTTTDVSGNAVTLRQPATYDSRVVNTDGTVNYTKANITVRYDANGFPIFNAKADLYLDAAHINSRSDLDHFKAANEALAGALRNDPSLAGQLGLSQAQVNHIMRSPPAGSSPPGLTWHHHQDTGRMQLVDRVEHNHFSGGHTGGMALWGGGR